MNISEKMREVIKSSGRNQVWVINRMNEVYPNIHLDRSKMSASLNSKRKISADELLAFCMAMEIDPDIFVKR